MAEKRKWFRRGDLSVREGFHALMDVNGLDIDEVRRAARPARGKRTVDRILGHDAVADSTDPPISATLIVLQATGGIPADLDDMMAGDIGAIKTSRRGLERLLIESLQLSREGKMEVLALARLIISNRKANRGQ